MVARIYLLSVSLLAVSEVWLRDHPIRFSPELHQLCTLIPPTGKRSLYPHTSVGEAKTMLPRLAERRPPGRIWVNQENGKKAKEPINLPRPVVSGRGLGRRQWGGRGGWGGVGGEWGGGHPGGGWWGGDQPEQAITITTTRPQETQTQTVIVTTGNTPTTRVVVTTQQPTTQVIVTTQRPPDPSPTYPTTPSSPSTGASGVPGSGSSESSTTGTHGQPANVVNPRPSEVTDSRGLPLGSVTNTLESGIQPGSSSVTASGSVPSTGIDTFPKDGGENSNASANQGSQVPVGAIVGSVLGGLIVILLAVLLWICLLKRLRRQARAADAYPFNGAGQGNSGRGATDTTTTVPPEPPAAPAMTSGPPTLPPILTKGSLFASRPTSPSSSSDLSPSAPRSPLDREEVMRAIHTLQAFSPIGEHRPPEDPRVTEAVEALQAFLSQNRNTMSDFGGFSVLNPPPAYQEGSSRLSRQQRQSMTGYSSKPSV
ncbi:hypothetical protein BKA70DRAFT_1535449 [Coprinopsis sp. MPI-PUGE-AT-0042]|nr:hypothetical protein BKA70DRAFT_1535449 [Coprinopsis sp. MPI-PUGE-AT-0042]